MNNRLLVGKFVRTFLMLICCLGLAVVCSFAQQTDEVVPPSPDAAALGMYGDIPVSTYSGVPNISIPLYNLKYRDVNIPLSLNYHASGISVEQDASWVGLGWVLNAGGVITRVKKHGDDMQFANDDYSEMGNYSYNGYPFDPDDSYPGFSTGVCHNEIDSEPDIFYFNFLGKTGSFVLEKGQNATSNYVSATPLQAEKIEIKYDKANRKWQVRTADGYAFYFGTMELTETMGAGGFYGLGPEFLVFPSQAQLTQFGTDLIVSAWYLDKIVTPLGEEINYVYDSRAGHLFNYYYGSARISIAEAKQTQIEHIGLTQCYAPPSQVSGTKTFTFHAYLKEINYPLGKIVFNKSLRDDMIPLISQPTNLSPYLIQPPHNMNLAQFGPQKLDNIQILDKSGVVIKKFELEYSYFNSQVTGQDKYDFRRLKLDKVRECGSQGCNPYYQLFYDETHSLPSKYSLAQDFWGYYNGAHSNVSRIPYGTFYYPDDHKFYSCGDSDRQPNGLYMTAGMLTKIVYPTGGSSEFEFEPHDYNQFSSDAFIITDFVNNSPTGIVNLITAGNDPAPNQTFTFTLTGQTQEINIDGVMTYYLSATTSAPCNVTDPGIYYVGNEPWYSLQNTTTSSFVTIRGMSDFLNFFVDNYQNHCSTQPQTPDDIDPIYRKRETFLLGPGTYELKVYTRQHFNLNVTATQNGMPSRAIPLNGNGVFAKTAGGLRVKKITTRDNLTSVAQVKRYEYNVVGENNQKYSSGKLLLYPNYHIQNFCNGDLGEVNHSIMGRSWNNAPLSSSGSGSIVGYDKVIEYLGLNEENGRTEYFYVNQIEEPLPSLGRIEGFPTVKRTSNGLLMDAIAYNSEGDIVKSENYEYNHQLTKDIRGIATKHLTFQFWYSGAYVYRLCEPKAMLSQPYSVVSDRWVPSKKKERLYAQGSTDYKEIIIDYEYDTQTHLQLKSEQSTASNGDAIKSVYSYPSDGSWIPTAMWQDKFIYNKIVKKELFRNNNINSTYKAFYSAQASTFLLNKEEVAAKTSPFETVNTYNYTANGNVQDVTSRNGITQTYLWDYNNSFPIAKANASLADIAYTSFEADGKGNWAFAGITEANSTAPSGNKAYNLSGGDISKSVVNTTSYIICYWRPVGTSALSINGTLSGYPISGRTVNGWKYYEHKVSNQTAVTLSGTGLIDEVRLCPVNTLMTCYSYDPLIGITSQSDSNGRIIYYTYDTFGRLQYIKDQDKNIVKVFDYKYQEQQ